MGPIGDLYETYRRSIGNIQGTCRKHKDFMINKSASDDTETLLISFQVNKISSNVSKRWTQKSLGRRSLETTKCRTQNLCWWSNTKSVLMVEHKISVDGRTQNLCWWSNTKSLLMVEHKISVDGRTQNLCWWSNTKSMLMVEHKIYVDGRSQNLCWWSYVTWINKRSWHTTYLCCRSLIRRYPPAHLSTVSKSRRSTRSRWVRPVSSNVSIAILVGDCSQQ